MAPVVARRIRRALEAIPADKLSSSVRVRPAGHQPDHGVLQGDRRSQGPACTQGARARRPLQSPVGDHAPDRRPTGYESSATCRHAGRALIEPHRSGVAAERAILPRWTTSDPGTRLVVALDGPGSSGKSSVGAAAALRVGYRFCDTGLLYRAVTWLALARQVSASYPHAVRGLVDEVELAPDEQGRFARVLVDGTDHTEDVRGPAVDEAVSAISAIPELRLALLDRQRSLAAPGGIVMAGRDIGTVVLPTPTSRSSSRPPSRNGRADARTNATSTRRVRGGRDPRGTAPPRRARFDPRGRTPPPRGRRPHHLDRRQPLRRHGRGGRQRDPRCRGPARRRTRAEGANA